jgi:hypothetical protein
MLELVDGFQPELSDHWALSEERLAEIQVALELATAQEPREARWWAARGKAAELRGDEQEAAECVLKADELMLKALKTSGGGPLSLSLAAAVRTRVFYLPTRSSSYARAVKLLRESGQGTELRVAYLVTEVLKRTLDELGSSASNTEMEARLEGVLEEAKKVAADVADGSPLGWWFAGDFLHGIRKAVKNAPVRKDQKDWTLKRVDAVEAEAVAPGQQAWKIEHGAELDGDA